MESFAEIISRLLLRHNCVIMPDFGGFVARTSPSEIDEARGVIHPPKKSILFNQQLTISDGLLISEYALASDISFTASHEKIKQIICLWKEELKAGKTITIDKVGTLQLGENDSLQFVQDRFFNLLLSSFGLGSVKFLPVVLEEEESINEDIKDKVEEKTTVLEKDQEDEDILIIDHPASRQKSSRWKIALTAACILPIAFYSYWLPVKTTAFESGVFAIQDFNPFSETHQSKYKSKVISNPERLYEDNELEQQIKQLDSSAESFSYKWDDSTFYTIPLKKQNIQPTIPPVIVSPVIIQNPVISIPNTNIQTLPQAAADISFTGIKTGKKYAIIGCFADVNNAKNYVQELGAKGINASFLDFSNGLYRLSIEESSSIDSLQPTILKASSLGYNTWILK
ncbi:MAG: hypothetical protein ACKO5W_00210 [Crocinitomicaceae bacterium]